MLGKFLLTSALAATVLAQDSTQPPTIDSPPSLTQCIPALITWHNGEPPYYVDVIPGGETGAQPVENLASRTNATSLTWVVNIAPQRINLRVTDNEGRNAYSAIVNVSAGSTDCLNSNSSVSDVGGGAGGATDTSTDAGASQTSADASATQTGTDAGGVETSASAAGTETSAAGGESAATTSAATGASAAATSAAAGTATSAAHSAAASSAAAASASPTGGATALKVAFVPIAAVAAVAAYFI